MVDSSNRWKLWVGFACIIMIFLITSVASAYQADAMLSESSDSSIIGGQVFDSVTGQIIEDATIAVWEVKSTGGRRPSTVITLLGTTQTGSDGTFEIQVEGGFLYRVYVYRDDPSSPGYDYLPKLQSFNVEKGNDVNMTVEMVPAASIIFEGELLFVDSSQPPDSYGFTVVPNVAVADSEGCILTYGTATDSHSRFINMNPMHVIIPAYTSLEIWVKAQVSHTFVLDDPQFSNLGQGKRVVVGVEQYSLPYNLNLTKDFMRLVKVHINETENTGFYVLAEKRDLEKVSTLIKSAEEKLVAGLYEACYADLREAYTKATYIDGKVQVMYADASASTTIIFIFLALTSTVLSSFLSEHAMKKALGTGLFYILFLATLFHVYVGCQIIDTLTLLTTAGLSILASFLIAFLLPRLFPMTSTAVFSMAKRNLRGRKIRFSLTLITVTVLVMGFVALTSFSTEYGFMSSTLWSGTQDSEGLLVRQPLPEIPMFTPATQVVATFTPLDTSVVEWLQMKPEVTLAAPKVENFPVRRPLGSLSTSNQRLSLFGVLGISPHVEAATTGFDKLVVEGQYLSDDEANAILISVGAAAKLNVQVGESLVFRVGSSSLEVKLVGLLSDYGLSHITDFDGSPMIPDKLIIVVEDGLVIQGDIDPCEPSEVVVITWQTALQLSSIYLSKIDVLIQEGVDLLPFARQIALERDYWVWAAVEGQINLLGLMSYIEAKGVSVFIPWLIVILNVVITMINAIYERRREIHILSSVGLNPSHITSLFGAEALIIGMIGGGIGYVLGLSLYKLMPFFSVSIDVRQKISAAWSLASLAIAITAVLVGAFMALKSSVIVTPSLLRRWKAEEKPSRQEPWVFEIPYKAPQEEITALLEHIRNRLQEYQSGDDIWISRITQVEEETPDVVQQSINFIYHQGRGAGSFLSHNTIVASKRKEDKIYTLRLICDTSEDHAYTTASFVRQLFMAWSVRKN